MRVKSLNDYRNLCEEIKNKLKKFLKVSEQRINTKIIK